ncbi:tryptophan transporter [Bacillus sp. CECT 9360]|uniref:tryptophan transporter n=1 Tax=Bacillus sp. CECT 9360 TaxID=2845821 RepID=UPI001E6219FC|nr:tryptophan transporter [Bacillus sp. CECT 9360]CAH0344383.1 putative tryptophan transport protein [Bacillus sp. CECT 9360]
MNTKVLVSLSLLVGMGAALHVLIPGLVLGMKPDIMLTMTFLAIVLFPEKKNVFLVAIASGVISGLTTNFPGGFLPNIIDKFITAFVFYFMLMALKKYATSTITVGALTAIGTLLSGIVFLGSAYFLFGLPGAFVVLFGGTVLPAALINTIIIVILYPIVSRILKKSNITAHVQ